MTGEAALRNAVRRAPGDARAAASLADLLNATGRPGEALAVIRSFVESAAGDILTLTAAADALKALGRLDEAISLYRRACETAPRSAVAEHNLGGALGDAQHFDEAKAAARGALAKGLDAPETWLVLARAHQGLGELDRAESAYREAIRRRDDFADALADLSQLIWMRSGELGLALQPLDVALARAPGHTGIVATKARLLEYAGEQPAAYACLAEPLKRDPRNWMLQVQAAQLASNLDPASALAHARAAFAQAPDVPVTRVTLCQAELSAGMAADAERTALALHERAPTDQHAIALLATAWRLLGDKRYEELYDYDAFISIQSIDTPNGWAQLQDYLSDLAAALRQRHIYRAHPLGQSVRGGSQTEQTLSLSQDPAIQAFFQAIDGPIRRHLAGLGSGNDPLRRRIGKGYRLISVWSVRLEPGGSHADHVHQKGWLSSACYVAVPAAAEIAHQGWLKFGEPGVATRPPLAAERFVQPEPGRLVLFPSYMWHGVAPFSGPERRLAIAFDVAPA